MTQTDVHGAVTHLAAPMVLFCATARGLAEAGAPLSALLRSVFEAYDLEPRSLSVRDVHTAEELIAYDVGRCA